MNNSPTVSVCIPVFNGERYLAESIESVLAQTFEDFELVISDNASTDATANIVSRYAKQDKRIVSVRNKENIGLFENYNSSMHHSSGRYIKLFAHDDLLDSTQLEKMVAILHGYPDVTLVGCGKRIIDLDGKEIGSKLQFPDSRLISGRDVIRYNLIRSTNWVGEPGGVMFRRECIGNGFDPSYYHSGDIEYYFRMLEHSNFYFISEVLCSFRVHNQSASANNHASLLFALDLFRLGKVYRHYLEEIGETEDMFFRRTLETIAINVDHFCNTEGLTFEKFIKASEPKGGFDKDSAEVIRQLYGFKEISFRSMRYLTEVLAQLHDLQCRTDCERERLETELVNLRNSTSWKITAPLRKLVGQRDVRQGVRH